MALDFIPGTDEEGVEWDTISGLSTTLTCACKVRPDSISVPLALFEQGDPGTANDPLQFQLTMGTNGDLNWRIRDDAGTVTSIFTADNALTANKWNTCIGTRTDTTSMDVYAEEIGTALITATGSITTGTLTVARLICGGVGETNGTKGGPTSFEMNGKMAELAVWDGVALNAAERQAYHDGVSPMMIRPDKLVFYVPLYAIGVASAHENIATATNYNPIFNGTPTAFSDHPPMGRPVRPPIGDVTGRKFNACLNDFVQTE